MTVHTVLLTVLLKFVRNDPRCTVMSEDILKSKIG